ncbi:cytosolic phospholipase A2 beta-like isoform X2 [Bufo gargarizans]|uniref:cytosolic phospholipase A2 beta-like isoform X2 n=1 Tax=Bufo gargarizans TaxID=30331 RepID=UPI001CF320CA|nr:cytosolic phospholipase A2 beta-like isoform X2 [Bufo gargarizans]
MARIHSAVAFHEDSEFSLVTVKVVQASHIPWADWMSNADCYVCLWLPTCSTKILKTKTVANTSDPVWNETFQFTICNNVKNMIQLTLHDEDVITGNDLLYSLIYDVDKIAVGETQLETFTLNPNGPENLQVEFTVQKFQGYRENILTNGVIVAREMSCLDVIVDKHRIPEYLQGKHVILSVEDSCEKKCRLELNPCTDSDHLQTCRFHYLKRWDPQFTAHLEGIEDHNFHIIPVKLLPLGQEQKILLSTVPARPLEVKFKAKDCPDKLSVRMGFDICDDEKLYLSKRRRVVANTLKRVLKLDRDLEDHEIPVIAVTTTGGGVRAMTALYGTLSGLKKLDLLGCVTYITGASGSTWSMSKLYEDPNWSQKDLSAPIQDACRNVTKSKTSAFSFDRLAFYREELRKRAEIGYKTSFTDLWGLVIESMFCDGVNETKLSDQRKALAYGQNPLPLCLAMNVKPNAFSTLDYKEWCEFSPYEVGLLKYGAFIRSEDFGSEFFMGRQTKPLPESRICYLQGLWSNVFSINLMDAWFAAVSSEHFWHRFTRDNVYELEDEEEALHRRQESSGLLTRARQPAGEFSRSVREILTNRPLDGEHHNFMRGLQMHKDYSKHNGFCAFDDTELDNSPNSLTPSTEELCLVDSAYYINASFPPLLRKERKVDILMSFDYGLSKKFTSVERTQEYCHVHDIHFPKIDVCKEDRTAPKECYVFKSCGNPECPTILHFPLVDDTFKQFKHPGVERLTDQEKADGLVNLGSNSPYGLLKVTYSKEDFDKLVNLTEYNVENNENTILQVLREAIACKQNSKPS